MFKQIRSDLANLFRVLIDAARNALLELLAKIPKLKAALNIPTDIEEDGHEMSLAQIASFLILLSSVGISRYLTTVYGKEAQLALVVLSFITSALLRQFPSSESPVV